MEIMGTLVWDSEIGEGKVFFPSEFLESDWIVQADAIVDWIASLQSTYDKMLAKPQ